MTEEEKKAVELKEAEAAAAKAKEEVNQPSEIEKQLAEKDALIEKLSTERENYKKGMLKAKGKLPKEDEEEDEEDIDAKIERKVQEKMLDTELAKAQKEKDDLLKKTLARMKELETAFKNRDQIATSDTGSGSESKFTVKDNVLSDEKLKQLKALGWNDKKIELFKKNLTKVK